MIRPIRRESWVCAMDSPRSRQVAIALLPRAHASRAQGIDSGSGAAGLVFAFTMMSMSVSKLIVIGQVGTTIGLGLLFDTLVVRSLMTPSIAALLGKWFWWPQHVRPRPVPAPWPKPIQAQPQKAVF